MPNNKLTLCLGGLPASVGKAFLGMFSAGLKSSGTKTVSIQATNTTYTHAHPDASGLLGPGCVLIGAINKPQGFLSDRSTEGLTTFHRLQKGTAVQK